MRSAKPAAHEQGGRVLLPASMALSKSRPIIAGRSIYTHGMEGLSDVHAACELGVVARGPIGRRGPWGAVIMERGGVWFSGPWEPHGFDYVRQPADAYVFEFPLSLLLSSLPGAMGLSLPFVRPAIRASLQPAGPEDREAAVNAAKALYEQVKAAREGWALLSQLDLLRLLAWLTRRVSEPVFRDSGVSAVARVIPVIEMVQSRLGEKVTLESAAAHLHVSRSSFAAMFTQAMGMPFAKYLLECRLRSAWRELLSGEDKLQAIARRCGFHDSSHLSRHFRARFGVAPGRVRRQRGAERR